MTPNPGNIIFIDLPEETTEVLVSVIFRYGYFNESNAELGLGHLLEHIIADRFGSSLGHDNMFGTTSDRKVQFDMTFRDKGVGRDLSLALKTIFDPLEPNEDLLSREKAKIQSEIIEKSVNYYEWLRVQTVASIVSSPAYIKRNRFGQLSNIKSASYKDLEAAHQKLIKKPAVICIGGYKMSSNLKKELTQIVLDHLLGRTDAKSKSDKIVRPKKKTIKKYYPTLPERSAHTSLVFPGPSYADSAVERYALTFINDELYHSLDRVMEKLGIYTVDYEYYIRPDHGFISFSSFTTKMASAKYQAAFFAGLKGLLGNKDLEKTFKKYLSRRKKNIREDWANNYKRMGWVVDDMADFGFRKDAKGLLAELDTVTLADVKKIAKKTFDPAKMYTLTVLPEGDKKWSVGQFK